MNRFLVVLICLIFSIGTSFAQISQGGKPLQISHLKSAEKKVIYMPKVFNEVLLENAKNNQKSMEKLKSFEFAKSFDVNYSPVNAGEWYIASDGTQVWQLIIGSEGAKSINLIFDNFKLPKGARLFLFNENTKSTIGAFTALNNKVSGKFAVMPVLGDEITVQYEIPSNFKRNEDFVIKYVNHDYVGILKYSDRRPLGKEAGDCNVDINCEMGEEWSDAKDAVCRLIVHGKEICTGTLINNTADDQKPYVISAAHCYDQWEYAETTIYTFNYESPFCAPLDGDPSNSISGALMKAQYDSLDFALVEMSLVPPPEFRPYYAGWDHSGNIPTNSVSIHHPQGDIKKIAFDDDSPEFSNFNSDYAPNGFIKILRWEVGVTESGSSGGPLFNPEQNLIGTLTGGVATCANPVRDYFSRFDLAWNFKSEYERQLKHWLDPINSGEQKIDGQRFYTNENLCGAFTNLIDSDNNLKEAIYINNEFKGYWGGTNNHGITEFVERYSIYGNEQLSGISLGVAKINDAFGGGDSEIKIKIYNGNRLPESLIYEQSVLIKNLEEDAMNFIGFSEDVKPAETFFIGFELSNMQPADSFVVYQSLRNPIEENFFYFQKNGQWYNFQEANEKYNSMANVFEVIACNIDGNASDTPLVVNPLEFLIYPNPTASYFTLEGGQDIDIESISVYNLLGKKVSVALKNYQGRKVQIDLNGNLPGIYFVQVKNGKEYVTQKISYAPW